MNSVRTIDSAGGEIEASKVPGYVAQFLRQSGTQASDTGDTEHGVPAQSGKNVLFIDSSLKQSLSSVHSAGSTTLDDIDKLREAIEQTPLRTANRLSIVAIRGLAGQAYERYQKLLEASTRLPIERLSHAMDDSWTINSKKTKKYGTKLAESDSVVDFIGMAHKDQLSVQAFVGSFLGAAALKEKENQRSANIRALQEKTHEVCSVALPGETIDFKGAPVGKNHLSLYNNIANNYLRLAGVLPEVDPNMPFKDKLYLFASSDTPTDFAQRTVMQRQDEVIVNKDVLEIGPGNGADAQYFLTDGKAKSVEVIDDSDFVLAQLNLKRAKLSSDLQGRLVIPRVAQDMCDALAEMVEQGKTVDTIYLHSVLHFLDRNRLDQALDLMSKCLRPGGHLAFSLKAPEATMDGHGIRLINDVNTHAQNPAISGVNDRAWLNHDGQIRHYSSYDVWDRTLGEKFTVLDASKSYVRGYAAPDRKQLFLNFICRKEQEKIVLSPEEQHAAATATTVVSE